MIPKNQGVGLTGLLVAIVVSYLCLSRNDRAIWPVTMYNDPNPKLDILVPGCRGRSRLVGPWAVGPKDDILIHPSGRRSSREGPQ